ncbi:Hypothetical predicted protein [Mytilus galloprovincialis]|uniref:SWIM-type domain-containing protein n=1 Tax=Mytilus galloprovincialis TaxID=29158 RepID=A0A8B6GGF9_MYTGA|nr:Hypothetical predicted protein [Mytilus galloprovincialis]
MDDNELVGDVEQELKFDGPLPVLDNPDHFPWVLTEDDIPGASLQGKLPHLLKVPELQFWLRCRGISVAGLNKSQLVSTVQNILPVQTKSTPLYDPDYPYYTDKKNQQLTTSKLTDKIIEKFPTLKPPVFPVNDWKQLENVTDEINVFISLFTSSELYKYFEVMAKNRGTDLSFRTLSRGAKIFHAGFVKDIVISLQNVAPTTSLVSHGLYIKAFVYASMRKETHEVRIQIKKYDPQNQNKVKITFAVCLCKAGLSGTCGHVSAVLHQLIEWSQRYKQKDNSLRCEKKINIDDNTPCTSKQNTWKPPKKKSLLPKTCIADYLSVWEKQPTKRRQKRD